MRLISLMRPVFVCLCFAFLTVTAQGAEQIVELRLQHTKCLCGIVTYPNGDPVRDAKIEELGADWKGSLRSVRSDSQGHFALSTVKGRKTYYLEITAPTTGVNPLRVPVQVRHFWRSKSLRLTLRLA